MDGFSPVQGQNLSPLQDGFSPVQGQNLSPSQDEFSPVQGQNLSPSQDGFSPVQGQNLSSSLDASPSDVNLSSPPRSSPSGNDNITMTGMDLLDTQDALANNNCVVGTLIPAPSPRRSTQSPVTHQLQQTLRNDAHEQVNGFDYSSPAHSGDGNGGASAFSTFNTNSPTIVETGQEGLADDSANKVQVDLIPRASGWFPPRSGASNEAGTAYDSGLQTLAENTTGNLVIDTNDDPGRADFIISVGALGNASGTPLDGSHNMSFGENNDHDGMAAYSGSDSSTSYATPVGYDASDPEVIARLLTQPPQVLTLLRRRFNSMNKFS